MKIARRLLMAWPWVLLGAETTFRRCGQCQTLFEAFGRNGDCPARGARGHEAVEGEAYTLRPAGFKLSMRMLWKPCKKCHSLFRDGVSQMCVLRRKHETGLGGRSYAFGDQDRVGTPGWKLCKRCQVLFYSKGDGASACYRGGRHEAEPGLDFTVPASA
jgi:hypothetical protein